MRLIKKKIIQKIGNNNNLFEDIDNEIIDIIKNENAKYILFLRKQAENLMNESVKIQNEFQINNEFNKDKYKKIHSNLVNYMNLKRINNVLDALNKMKNAKKMIII